MIGIASLTRCMDINYHPLLGYSSEFHILSRGLFLFKVKKEDNDTKLLNQRWSWGPSGLILRKWHVNFNAKSEPHNIQQIWVTLLGLPMVFWIKYIL